MSQWNNSYAYNNQYQGSENWNEMNGQYANQAHYRSDVNQQYVSFNEFINQMQNTNATAASNFNPVQYEGYPNNQYSYQNAPSGSQTQGNYNYGPTSATSNGPSEVETYQVNQNQYKPQPKPNQYTNEMVLNSNLTATATEFVPKSSGPKPSSSAQNIPEPTSSSSNEVPTTSSNHSSSSNKNWRERPSCNTQKSDKEKPQINGYENNKNFGNNRNKDSYRKENNRHYENNSRPENNGRNNDNNGRNNDNRTRHENNSMNNENPVGQEKNSRHNGNRGRATENNVRGNDTSGQNNEYSERNNDKGGRYNENNSRSNENSRRYNENTGRYNENNSGRHNENSSRHNENNGRYSENSRNSVASNETGNRNNEYSTRQDREYDNNRNDRRNGKGKAKGKDSDNRTFYNSSINVQDARNGRGEGSGRNRTWAGSQRIRERENMDDEQFANNYVPQKEERLEKERSYKPQSTSSPARYKNKNQGDQVSKEMTQRERLTEQLDKGTLECLVCCERVKQIDPVWACGNCYHVFHLKCIKKWAVSSSVEGKWRCPACQNCCSTVPSEYRCMCGAMRSPEYVRGAGAHTCGAACGRPRVCPHRCPLRCHPGPCPPCQATVNKQCGCGAETRSVLCSSKLPQVCGRVCGRPLACGNHKCVKDCHEGPCDECDKTITEVCYCPLAAARSAACGAAGRWSCGGACGRVAACGAHVCRAACHAPPCARCPRDPRDVTTCPCGKNKLDKDERKLCTDPIPLCGNICAKPLPCGPDGDRHFCKIDCHEGPCPPCPEKTLVQCRCGHSSREVPCSELPETLGNVLCQKKCNKKLSCGRHRCRAVCCAGGPHRCGVVCGRSLSCGLHRCDEFCHTGHCAVCPRLSFTELRCTCGATALLPPVACGARAPACSAPCGRARACGHAALHACHAGACPPCVVLTARRCHGGHEQRRTVPCDQPAFSCGRPCDKPLPCGKHSCINTCHAGPCDTTKCTQPCREKRPSCGHECSAPCHVGGGTPCPSAAPCRRAVRATCQCGRRTAERTCSENAKDFAKMVSALAAAKIQEGESVDLSDVQRPGNMLKTLECDDSCRQEARSRALALALQLRNPDVSSKLAPRYSELLRQTAARDAPFAAMVHDRLTELVQRAKKSKQKTRSHSFPSMNRQKRQFIHEMCEHFGCESVAYDAEPNRNVVATADKEKSWLPAMSVCEVVSREAGRRRVPPPVVRQQAPTSSRSSSGWATLTSTNAWAARSQAKVADEQVKETKEETKPAKIDYFDNPPEN